MRVMSSHPTPGRWHKDSMPRGFQKDVPATDAAYASGKLIDAQRRSFISQPKAVPGECDTPEPHLLLAGADKTKARMALFQREHNRCQKCKCVVVWGSDEFGWSEYGMRGEWNHIRHKPWNKCDCDANAELLCPACHRRVHSDRSPRFGPEKVTVDA